MYTRSMQTTHPKANDNVWRNVEWALRFVWASGRALTIVNVVLTILQSLLPLLVLYLTKLVIDTVAELQALYNLATDPAPTVTAFFVDQINACDTVPDISGGSGHYRGCAQLPGRFMVEDFHEAELEPAELMGHELGHATNLGHSSLGLMTAILGFGDGFSLDEDQVKIILQSPLVQIDNTGQRFIQITPIAIITPEPSTLLLVSAALGALLLIKTRKSIRTRQ